MGTEIDRPSLGFLVSVLRSFNKSDGWFKLENKENKACVKSQVSYRIKDLLLIKKREWDRNRQFVRIRFRRPASAQLSRAVKADEISVVEPTQPLRLARQSKNN